MRIKQSNVIKNEVIDKILSSQDLLKLLYYPDKKKDIYALDDLTRDQIKELRNNNIYRRKRVPANESNEMKTYLSLSYGGIVNGFDRNSSKYFKEYTLCIWVITNSSLDDILQGSRLDEIDDTINEIFQCKDVKAMQDSHVVSSQEINCPSQYCGRVMTLKIKDYNKAIVGGDIK